MRCGVAELTGSDFRARVRLSNKADETLADVGETCARVPVSSLAWLLASRKIYRVTLDNGRVLEAPIPIVAEAD
jgi:hypothetical protein